MAPEALVSVNSVAKAGGLTIVVAYRGAVVLAGLACCPLNILEEFQCVCEHDG